MIDLQRQQQLFWRVLSNLVFALFVRIMKGLQRQQQLSWQGLSNLVSLIFVQLMEDLQRLQQPSWQVPSSLVCLIFAEQAVCGQLCVISIGQAALVLYVGL